MLATRTLQASSANSSYQIPRSLRFRSENGSFLSKSFVTPTDNKKWTWSGWVKRAKISTSQVLFGAGANSNTVFAGIYFSSDNIDFFNYENGITWRRTTNAVYRDPSAWMHVVCIFDSNNATANDQVQIWVNGVRITSFSQTVNPGGLSSLLNNSSQPHTIGLVRTVSYNTYFDGYMADVNFIDGQALNPSSFGQTDLITGAWSAKRYTGTYGNNGFYLNFSDPTSTTTISYDTRPGAYSRNLRSLGTAIGGYTANGGLAAAFDGNISQDSNNSARASAPAAGYTAASAIGRDWGVGVTKIITAFRIYGQNNGGFVGNTSQTTNYKLQGSNDGTNYTDLMTAGTTAGVSSEIVTVTSGITTTTAYRYHRVIFNANGADNYYVAELELYEAGVFVIGPNDWATNNVALSGSTAISTFTSVGTTSWVAPAGVTSVQYLVVGGGGGGNWGGGGAGGFRTGTLSVTPGNSYTVTVGAGGAGGGSNGSNSVFSSITSIGGGAGPNSVGNGGVGGSGGGGGSSNGLGGAGTAGQGFAGGRGYSDLSTYTSGGGGGGSSQAGSDGGGPGAGGKGGDGTASSISGSTVIYAGGGGGYGDTYGPGVGGTGSGSTPNRGGGGTVSAGGSGIVILSYPGSPTVPTYDSMLDVPLSSGGGELGNYCTLNPLSTSVSGYVRQANLSLSGNSLGEYPGVGGTIYVSTGKWYWEYMATAGGTLNCTFGFSPATAFGGTFQTATGSVGYTNDTGAITVSGSTVTTGATFTSGDLIAVALDLTTGTAQFYKNNVATGALVTGLTGTYTPAMNLNYYPSNTLYLNCGQRPFNYAPPTGFLPLHTGNFPIPAVRKSNQYFDTTIYTGNGTSQSITNSASMQPDFVWIKNRATTNFHQLQDSLRGPTKQIFSNDIQAENTDITKVTSFDVGGFSVGSGAAVNGSGNSHVAWQWRAGGAAVTNADGSISSQVSVNQIAGFSIVKWTGNGVNAQTIGHGLGQTPAMILHKAVGDGVYSWNSWHKGLSTNYYIGLNTTSAQDNSQNIWPTVGITSSVITTTSAAVKYNNLSGINHIAYVFAEVAGYSKFGSYIGNASTDGPFVYCGFRPKYIMIKRIDGGTNSWYIRDTARNTNNVADLQVYADLANAEATEVGTDMLANGFKIRGTSTGFNGSGATYIFMAFAEAPFKSALAR